MESISTFDIFKIGVGPSSSHTMGPWRAAQRFLRACRERGVFDRVARVRTDLYGSLAKTGHGHGTDIAVILALAGEDPETCATEGLTQRVEAIKSAQWLRLGGARGIGFVYEGDVVFHMDVTLPFHPNGVKFTAFDEDGRGLLDETYFSVGGGFVVQENESGDAHAEVTLRHPIEKAADLAQYCQNEHKSIPQVVMENELAWRTEEQVRAGLLRIWRVMQECVYRGCHTEGILPGGLNVVRRAATINRKLLYGVGFSGHREYDDLDGWMDVVRHSTREFQQILKWVSTFALAVNEENAAFGRVVTAPTNGAAGVIPAVMMYYWCFCRSSEQGIVDFMLTAGIVGALFKKGATISAAMGGCQAEIGVSSAMAAAGLTQCLGGTPGQAAMAAEIAMEHHLGMTCDPVGGLVQIPCIERNTMGAIKAITAANIALEGDPTKARVSLDDVIKTMWQTALDMQSKYKETAEGGLAVNVSVNVPEC
ncbi:MAG TPA: L-serine ammonia-lyase [Phycisphaerales bacterium]|nr:L-serine ammonia-lyase [Phycisphaerales bacterium]